MLAIRITKTLEYVSPLTRRPNSPLGKPQQNLLFGRNGAKQSAQKSDPPSRIPRNLKIAALRLDKTRLRVLPLIHWDVVSSAPSTGLGFGKSTHWGLDVGSHRSGFHLTSAPLPPQKPPQRTQPDISWRVLSRTLTK